MSRRLAKLLASSAVALAASHWAAAALASACSLAACLAALPAALCHLMKQKNANLREPPEAAARSYCATCCTGKFSFFRCLCFLSFCLAFVVSCIVTMHVFLKMSWTYVVQDASG